MLPKWWMLLALVVSLAACSTPTPSATATPLRSQAPTPTHTPLPTVTPIPTVTPTPVSRSEPPAPIDPFAQARRLGRGVNLGNALEAPREGEWGMVIEEGYFRLIAEAGFDTIRVPIRWSAHALTTPPYTVDETFFSRIDWVIENGLKQGLNVMINMHHYDEVFVHPDQHKDRFVAIWRQIAVRYRDMPDTLFYEPLNEPHDALTADVWNNLLAEVIPAIRQVDGVHTLVIGGADWGGIQSLTRLRLPKGEENVICTFHFYDPFLFTHQGAEWVGAEYGTLGVQWPGPPVTPLVPNQAAQQIGWIRQWFEDYNSEPADRNPCSPNEIAKQFDRAMQYGKNLGKPLFLGEFGAYSTADMQSRADWTATVRREAEARGFPWAYWEFGAGFGVYDRATQRWRDPLLRALIPQE